MPFLKHKTIVILLLVASAVSLYSQEMTLQEVIDSARTRSVSAVAAKSNFVSSYWSWRSYQASRLPSLHMYGNVGGLDRSLRLLQDFDTG